MTSSAMDNNKEGFIHNVSFLRKCIDEVDVVIHENAKEHIVVVAANFGEALDVWTNIYALGANKDLDIERE